MATIKELGLGAGRRLKRLLLLLSSREARWATPFEQMMANGRYLTFRQYQHKASQTAMYPSRGEFLGLNYVVLGLTSEAGEVAGKIKKIIRDKGAIVTAFEREAILDEGSDVLWYLSQLAFELGIPLEEMARHNLRKLKSRMERGVIKGDGDKR